MHMVDVCNTWAECCSNNSITRPLLLLILYDQIMFTFSSTTDIVSIGYVTDLCMWIRNKQNGNTEKSNKIMKVDEMWTVKLRCFVCNWLWGLFPHASFKWFGLANGTTIQRGKATRQQIKMQECIGKGTWNIDGSCTVPSALQTLFSLMQVLHFSFPLRMDLVAHKFLLKGLNEETISALFVARKP